jgi:predicted TIM-barrel fold metal-dependent hydrolase
MKGIKLLPMYAGFTPLDPELDDLWVYATKHNLPVLLHTGTTFVNKAPLRCTFPRLIDEVALRFPDVKIIMAHLGHPWEGECIVTIHKHPNVYADCSALHYRPFQLYHSLMLLQEYGCWEKLLFGSDYPYTTVDASLKGMRSLNDMLEGTALPRLNMDAMEAMFHRDTLKILEIR